MVRSRVRSTSTYLTQKVVPMLPRLLCEELCSLNPGVERLAFSAVWELTAAGEVRSPEWPFGEKPVVQKNRGSIGTTYRLIGRRSCFMYSAVHL